MTEEHWIAKRSQLRQLLQDQPNWTNQMYAVTCQMSVSWVKDWKRVFARASPNDEVVVFGREHHRRTPFDRYDPNIIEAILEIRDHPPDYCPRIPGPAVIQYELQQRYGETPRRYPRSTSTIWRILDENQRILRVPNRVHEPFERPEPMKHWEIDFADVKSVPPDPDGKKQHVVEMLNIVDRGTSILVDSAASGDYTAETAILAIVGTFIINGLPDSITLDRDPRFLGGWQGDDFPSAFMRFLLGLNIALDICPPHRPDLKPFVERVHRTIDEECIQIKQPDNLADVLDALENYRFRYNSVRPHQGDACGNQPPYVAFPKLPHLRRLPETIDPDAWLRAIHGRQFHRSVQKNGSVRVDRRSYYVGTAWKGQRVVLQVDADNRTFKIFKGRQVIKSVPIKGLYDEVMPFADYLNLIRGEAKTEWRKTKRLVRERRLAWAA